MEKIERQVISAPTYLTDSIVYVFV